MTGDESTGRRPGAGQPRNGGSRTGSYLSDQQIAAMTAAQRRTLILRLARPTEQLSPRGRAPGDRHRLCLGLLVTAIVLLIPWIGYLALTLPSQYQARNWTLVWVGFDAVLAALLAATAVLGWLRRQLMVPTGFAAGVLLLADVWFDILTAQPRDAVVAAGFAVLVDLPVAFVLIRNAVRLPARLAARLWLVEPGVPLWRVPLLALSRHELAELTADHVPGPITAPRSPGPGDTQLPV